MGRGGPRLQEENQGCFEVGRLRPDIPRRGRAAIKGKAEFPHAKFAPSTRLRTGNGAKAWLGTNPSKPLRPSRPLREVQDLRSRIRRCAQRFCFFVGGARPALPSIPASAALGETWVRTEMWLAVAPVPLRRKRTTPHSARDWHKPHEVL
jgi:hypothetical protein